ncbi:hypothetical protein [Xanthocytophaga agilis]|uniref:Uncharacterized protein n=1 Tax=Xanthocytophaga agilis TaxID=3048010 RepID=A0AAE3R768_9BACT|nr:hypothetical protein [Xanthocytophaga agilis]MDJ1505004.1 hypothetical protein [Xanthocytophaga agilis]
MYKNPIFSDQPTNYYVDHMGRIVLVESEPGADVEININIGQVDEMKRQVYNRLVQNKTANDLNNGTGKSGTIEVRPFLLKEAFQPVIDAAKQQAQEAQVKRELVKKSFQKKLSDTATKLANDSKTLTSQILNVKPSALSESTEESQPEYEANTLEKKLKLKPWMKYTLIGLAVVGVLAILYVLSGEESAKASAG